MRIMIWLAALGMMSLVNSQISPEDMMKKWGTGINLGNTLDAPHEGDWAPAAKESYFDAFKQVGFTSVRIPVQWDKHMGQSSPYTIDGNFMNRVEQVVGWSMARGFITIINSHHDDWLDDQGAFDSKLPRFRSLWKQVSDRFKDHDETLLFEVYNEPHVMNADQLNRMNAAVLPIIRATNPTRIVLFGGLQWMNPTWIIQNWDTLQFPSQDKQVMLEVHSYDPYDFTKKDPTIHWWGNDDDKNKIYAWMDSLKQWSITHGHRAVLLGEFGVTHDQNDNNGRNTWYQTLHDHATKIGFGLCVWDDNGWFQVYHRDNGSWDNSVLSALGKGYNHNQTISKV